MLKRRNEEKIPLKLMLLRHSGVTAYSVIKLYDKAMCILAMTLQLCYKNTIYFDITRLSLYYNISNSQESNFQKIRKFKAEYFITEFLQIHKK